MWLKYSSAPIVLDPGRTWIQDPVMSGYSKPVGLWITDETEDNWRSWCIGINLHLENLTHKHEVVLDESRLLILRSADELDAFERIYLIPHRWPTGFVIHGIDWPRVAQEHSGLVITPYIGSRRLTSVVQRGSNWYYTWDCASGVIWDAKAILAVKLLEIEPVWDGVRRGPDGSYLPARLIDI